MPSTTFSATTRRCTDAASSTYFLAPAEDQACYPVAFTQTEDGQTTVTVESYRDPMSAFPQTRLQCRLTKVN